MPNDLSTVYINLNQVTEEHNEKKKKIYFFAETLHVNFLPRAKFNDWLVDFSFYRLTIETMT